ncbi:MAG: DUF4190 domain-containing protein [Spirochaetales bacterium]|nr:DUF4190 domain-containing protein [Spirochaetales bacterium]
MSDFTGDQNQQGAYGSTPPPGSIPKTDGMAVASLVLGIIGILCCQFTGIIGLILGIVSMSNMKKNPALQGKGVAIGGIITSAVAILILILAIFFYVFIFMNEIAKDPDFWQNLYNR